MVLCHFYVYIATFMFPNHQSISYALLCIDQMGAALLNICSGISAVTESALQQVHVKGFFAFQIPASKHNTASVCLQHCVTSKHFFIPIH